MSTTEIERAVEFYNKASIAEEKGEMDLAEVYYLKSWGVFERVGGKYYPNAANALNALAFLRASRGDYAGALRSAKQSVQIMEAHKTQFASHDADLIHRQAWELINHLIGCETQLQRLAPGIG